MSDLIPGSDHAIVPVDAREYSDLAVASGGDPSSYGQYRELTRTAETALQAFPAELRGEVSGHFDRLPPAAMVAVVSEIGATAPQDALEMTGDEVAAYAALDPVHAELAREWGASATWRFGLVRGREERIIDRIVALGGGAAEGRAMAKFIDGLSGPAWKAVLRRLSEPWGVI